MRGCVAVLLLLAAPAAALDDSGVVVVDVVATDSRGRTIDNLKPGDFELREDGVLRPLDDVERAEAARPNARLFAIFLDEYHVSAANAARVRSTLTRFIDESLDPMDLLVVMRPLDSLLAIRLTRDREAARRTIEDFSGRHGDYTPRSESEQNYIAGTPARVEQLRAQITTSALNAIALHLGSLGARARKTLVVASEGVPGIDRRRGFESLPTMESVIRSANRSNVSVYALDPRPAAPAERSSDEPDVLRGATVATGGRALGEADLQTGIKTVALDAAGYYLLVYRSARPKDGAFHELRVGVKKAGVTLRARNGYWAPAPDEGQPLAFQRDRPPTVLGPPRHLSPFIRPWFGTARGAGGKTRVTFVWEPASRVPGDRARQPVASRLVLKATGPDGAALFEGPVSAAGPAQHNLSGEAGARAVFDAPPGVLRLQMSIEDDAAQPLDSDVRDVTVRDLNAPVVLGTAAFLRARTARDFHALENDPDAVPVVSREFSRTERLMIRFPAYAPRGVGLSVSARLLSRGGQAMRDLPVQLESAHEDLNQIDLPLASLAAGDYFVEVAARSPAGEAKDLLAFRVTN